MIVATDGIWEFIDNHEAIKIVAQFDDPQQVRRVTRLLRGWKQPFTFSLSIQINNAAVSAKRALFVGVIYFLR